MKINLLLLLFLLVLPKTVAVGQSDQLGKFEVSQRNVTPFTRDGITGIELDTASSDGIAWLKGADFSDGIIEFDVLGENKPGASFVGVIFHALNDTTWDGVYFRPFNFLAEKQINRDHMVQYVSHPDYPWYRLREERTGQFEKEIIPAPDPQKWLHARIEVKGENVSVFVNRATTPSLVVKKLNARHSGKIGFWVGFKSSGRFANLVLSKN